MTFHLIRINIFHYISVAHCSDLLKSGQTQSGVYSIDPDGKGSFDVYCDMRTDGGGWTVFQRRQDGSVDFYRGWSDYKSGFGQLTSEFWLGNDTIHRLTASRASSLRVELEDWNGVRVYAKYGQFNIGDEQAEYRLKANSYSGTAGDSLAYHNNMAFSTKDRDNDRNFGKCAAMIIDIRFNSVLAQSHKAVFFKGLFAFKQWICSSLKHDTFPRVSNLYCFYVKNPQIVLHYGIVQVVNPQLKYIIL